MSLQPPTICRIVVERGRREQRVPKGPKETEFEQGEGVGNFSLERFLLLGCTLGKSLCVLGVHIQHEVDGEVDDH